MIERLDGNTSSLVEDLRQCWRGLPFRHPQRSLGPMRFQHKICSSPQCACSIQAGESSGKGIHTLTLFSWHLLQPVLIFSATVDAGEVCQGRPTSNSERTASKSGSLKHRIRLLSLALLSFGSFDFDTFVPRKWKAILKWGSWLVCRGNHWMVVLDVELPINRLWDSQRLCIPCGQVLTPYKTCNCSLSETS